MEKQLPKWKLRENAARILADNGWPAKDIAEVLRWRETTAARRTKPMPLQPAHWAIGLELSVKADNAVASLGVATLPELESRVAELYLLKGVGAKTVAEVRAEIARIKAGGGSNLLLK